MLSAWKKKYGICVQGILMNPHLFYRLGLFMFTNNCRHQKLWVWLVLASLGSHCILWQLDSQQWLTCRMLIFYSCVLSAVGTLLMGLDGWFKWLLHQFLGAWICFREVSVRCCTELDQCQDEVIKRLSLKKWWRLEWYKSMICKSRVRVVQNIIHKP